jgi:hypothetical protein
MDGGAGADAFRIAGAAAGDVLTVTGGDGQDTLRLDDFLASDATVGADAVVVNLPGGGSFTISFTGIESIVFADGAVAPPSPLPAPLSAPLAAALPAAEGTDAPSLGEIESAMPMAMAGAEAAEADTVTEAGTEPALDAALPADFAGIDLADLQVLAAEEDATADFDAGAALALAGESEGLVPLDAEPAAEAEDAAGMDADGLALADPSAEGYRIDVGTLTFEEVFVEEPVLAGGGGAATDAADGPSATVLEAEALIAVGADGSDAGEAEAARVAWLYGLLTSAAGTRR